MRVLYASLVALAATGAQAQVALCGSTYQTSTTTINHSGPRCAGTIPDLSALTSLETLNLRFNQLTGTIPDLSALTSLSHLILDDNQLTGAIPDLSALTSLETLSLYGNQLTGTIPDLSALTSLETLNLRLNQLTGAIPDLSALTSLETLSLDDNDLTGAIPDLSALTSLRLLFLDTNQLTGTIPDLSALTSLSHLSLDDNDLTGTIPDLSALTSLAHLNLAGNDWLCPLPDYSSVLYNDFLDTSCTSPTATATPAVRTCAAGQGFPVTPAGDTAMVPCDGLNGMVSRKCDGLGVWRTADDSGCFSNTGPLLNSVFVGIEAYTSALANSESDCALQCDGDVLCNAYTYWQASGWCKKWALVTGLKTTSQAAVSDYSTGGNKCEGDVQTVYDVTDPNVTVLSKLNFASGKNADQCCQACHNDAQCVGWNYKFKGKCILFSSVGGTQLTTNAWSMSGVVIA